MGTVPYLLAFLVAIVVGLSILMLMDRSRTLAHRLRDFSLGGDGWILLLTGGVVIVLAGAVVGSLFGQVDAGATAGVALTAALWIIGLVWAHRRLR